MSRVFHLHGGSIVLDRIAKAGIEGVRLEWCDPVCEGPTPGGLDDEAWYRVRAAHLADALDDTHVATLERELREQDARLASIGADDELCIWAGPEWFCQSVLLALLGRAIRRVKTRNLSLVQGPMEPTGCSLAHLDDAALRALFAARTPIEAPVLAVAHRAWTAFCSSEPDDIVSLLGDDWPSLPHLREGLVRHLQELPDAASGLGRTEEEVLEAVRAGAGTDPEILKAVAAREEQPWLTDVMLRRLLQRMARGALPLLVDGAPVSLTPRGHAVLEGVERYVERRAVGGVIVDDPNASPLAP